MAKHEEDDELSVVMSDAEYKVAQELIDERKKHRDCLNNLHLVFKREDARRILDALPFNGCQMLPVIRFKNGLRRIHWASSDTLGLAGDLKTKFDFYCKNGKDFAATAAHNLMKKIEDAQVHVGKK